jgi:hypothetical protein
MSRLYESYIQTECQGNPHTFKDNIVTDVEVAEKEYYNGEPVATKPEISKAKKQKNG